MIASFTIPLIALALSAGPRKPERAAGQAQRRHRGAAMARRPAPTMMFVFVDRIVINRVRNHHTVLDFDVRWRTVERHVWTTTWWISFWDRPAFEALLPAPGAWIDRGWWRGDRLARICHGPDGWIVEARDGPAVAAQALLIVDSPYDWEVRHRRIWRPLWPRRAVSGGLP